MANSFFGRDMAVDLGTANTLVYARGRGVLLDEPSVVERLKERMHSRVLKVAELELEWEERREEHVQARIAEVQRVADGWEAAWSAEREGTTGKRCGSPCRATRPIAT